jgi:hypothetical protein
VRVVTNLKSLLGLDELAEHAAVERGLLGLAGLNQRFAAMEAFRAVSHLNDGDHPLMDARLRFAMREIAPEAIEHSFGRVIRLAGLPDPNEREVNVWKLLDLIESKEVDEFRTWLRRSDALTDLEITQAVDSLRARLEQAVGGAWGHVVRFLAVNMADLVSPFHPIETKALGMALGGIDEFLVDRLIPEPGPITFLTKNYPSIFDLSSG